MDQLADDTVVGVHGVDAWAMATGDERPHGACYRYKHRACSGVCSEAFVDEIGTAVALCYRIIPIGPEALRSMYLTPASSATLLSDASSSGSGSRPRPMDSIKRKAVHKFGCEIIVKDASRGAHYFADVPFRPCGLPSPYSTSARL